MACKQAPGKDKDWGCNRLEQVTTVYTLAQHWGDTLGFGHVMEVCLSSRPPSGDPLFTSFTCIIVCFLHSLISSI